MSKRAYQIAFWLIILAYAAYASIYIYRTSFVIDGQRYFTLFDDAMISMRYAQNLAHGNGLVWNAGGERVEGFSNPLWVVFLALFHFLPLPAAYIALPVQISGMLFFITCLFFIRKIAEELTQSPAIALVAVVLTAFYEQFSTWSLLGMEVSAALLIISAAVWMGLRTLKSGRFTPWLYVLLGVGTLLRMDLAVPFLAMLIFLALFDPINRRQHLLWGVSLLVAFLGGQTLLRYAYYGEWLPNTYYLKMMGAPRSLLWQRGIMVFFENFAFTFGLALLALSPFVLLLRWLNKQATVHETKTALLLMFVFASFCAYSIYVGGDAWESKGGANRFIATGLPLFMALLAYALGMIRKMLLELPGASDSLRSQRFQWMSWVGVWLLVVAALANFNAPLGLTSYKHWLLFTRHPFIPGSERELRIGLTVEQITTPEARIAVLTAGIIPYYANRSGIDLLGKCDKVIARQPMHITPGAPATDLRPGHTKWDYAYSINQLQPDVIAQMEDGFGSVTPYAEADYVKVTLNKFPMFIRKDSPNIRWDVVEALSTEATP